MSPPHRWDHPVRAPTNAGPPPRPASALVDVLDATAVYWAGRLTLCGSPDDLDRYDAAFAAYFGGEAPRMRSAPADQRQVLALSAPLEAGTGEGEDDAPSDVAGQASAAEHGVLGALREW